ncbi:MAG: oligosaccharide flippase family protein [Telluria sp.]
MSGIRLPLLYSFTEKYLLLAVNLGAGMALARLLTPEDTGVYSVGAVLAGMAQVLRDFGIGQFLVQERTLERGLLRAALGVSYAAAGILACLVALAAGPAGRFYHDARVGTVLRLLALNMLLIPLASVSLPLLRRELRFGAVCAVNCASGLAGAAASLVLAWRGYGYLSLALGTIAASVAGGCASALVRPAGLPWLPSLRGARRVLRFGAWSTAGTLVDEAGVAAPDLVVGKALGMEAAGIFGKAQGILAIFRTAVLAAVTPVLLPYYAERSRSGNGANAAFLATVSCLAACAWPFFAVLAVTARPAVDVLYGAQWTAAVPLIRIMCAASALYSMGTVSRYLFVATGQVALQARLDALAAAARITCVCAGALGGLHGAAWALTAAALVRTLLIARALRRACGIGPAALLGACWKAAVLATACAAAAWLAAGAADGVCGLAGAGAASTAAWLAGVALLRHPLAAEAARLWRRVAPVWNA